MKYDVESRFKQYMSESLRLRDEARRQRAAAAETRSDVARIICETQEAVARLRSELLAIRHGAAARSSRSDTPPQD